MMVFWQSLVIALVLLVLALLFVAGLVALRRRRRSKSPPRQGWLTDEMIRQIVASGTLSGSQVPDEELDLDEIAREEERFWSESWDESEPRWE
jgi:hypothetical protein